MQRMALIEQRIMQLIPADVRVWHHNSKTEGAVRSQLMRRIKNWLGQPTLSGSQIRTGQPDHSLTHAGSSLFGLAVKAPGFSGVGIDFEPWRDLDQRHHRLMLTMRERHMLPEASARQLLRIWTVKEACFKADCNGQQRWVTAYELQQPTKKSGIARVAVAGRVQHFRYLSLEVADGILSVAIKIEA